MLNLCYVYYLSKLTEFADTVFFVLRKKKTQITWLHLYHHALTPMEAWLLVKFISGMNNFGAYFAEIDDDHLILFRRQRNIPEHSQQLRSRADVLLLHAVRHGPTIPKVLVVEAIHDWAANRKLNDSESASITALNTASLRRNLEHLT